MSPSVHATEDAPAAPGSESDRSGTLVGSSIVAREMGTHTLKGIPDEWKLFAVEA